MKIEVHEGRIELTPENHLENQAIERWQQSQPWISGCGTTCGIAVPWAQRPQYVHGLTISFRPKPGP